jgi:uncharacterized protein YdaU (DUF1376 family)
MARKPTTKGKPPAFQFYAADFLIGCATMTLEQRGAYITLLCYQWDQDGLPNDKSTLAMLVGGNEAVIEAVLYKFEECSDGKLRNVRLAKVRAIQEEYSQRQTRAINKRWSAYRSKKAAENALKKHGV